MKNTHTEFNIRITEEKKFGRTVRADAASQYTIYLYTMFMGFKYT